MLADSVVLNGRFKGKKLRLGGFLSPELSFDGKAILFACTEAEPTKYKWTEKSTFHIFRVNVDIFSFQRAFTEDSAVCGRPVAA